MIYLFINDIKSLMRKIILITVLFISTPLFANTINFYLDKAVGIYKFFQADHHSFLTQTSDELWKSTTKEILLSEKNKELKYTQIGSVIIIVIFIAILYSYFRSCKLEDKSNIEDKLVILARLNANEGFYSFNDALNVAGKLQELGINASCEQSPGALMDSQDSYFLKVPVSQLQLAQDELRKILTT